MGETQRGAITGGIYRRICFVGIWSVGGESLGISGESLKNLRGLFFFVEIISKGREKCRARPHKSEAYDDGDVRCQESPIIDSSASRESRKNPPGAPMTPSQTESNHQTGKISENLRESQRVSKNPKESQRIPSLKHARRHEVDPHPIPERSSSRMQPQPQQKNPEIPDADLIRKQTFLAGLIQYPMTDHLMTWIILTGFEWQDRKEMRWRGRGRA